MKLRRSTREKKPPQHLQDFQLELDPTESLQTRAIRDELNQVESLLESLTPEAGKQSASANKLQTPTFTPEEEKQSAASISKLQNENLKLELELTRAKIELARVKSAMAHESPRWPPQTRRTSTHRIKASVRPKDRLYPL